MKRLRSDVLRLIDGLAEQERALTQAEFVAPCVRGGKVRTRVAGLVRTFAPQAADFEGWGVFRPADEKRAELVEEALLPLVAGYLSRLAPMSLRLAHPLAGQTWLSYPANESDARQRQGAARPAPVHLVTE